MPYTPTTWVSGTTPVDAPEMNNVETIYTEAVNSFERELFTPFVFSGLVCTRNGGNLKQLDVTAGVSFLKQASDSTLRRRATSASVTNQFLTVTASTTYFLDLNSDGTFSFGTSHSVDANRLAICSLTTDGSGNILVVTDARTTATTLLSGMEGKLTIGGAGGVAFIGDVHTDTNFTATGFLLFGATVSGSQSQLFYNNGLNTTTLNTPQAGAGVAKGIGFGTWDGAAARIPFSIGGQFLGALSWVDNSGRFHDNAGLVVVEGANNTVTPLKISGGTILPGTLGSREVFFLLA